VEVHVWSYGLCGNAYHARQGHAKLVTQQEAHDVGGKVRDKVLPLPSACYKRTKKHGIRKGKGGSKREFDSTLHTKITRQGNKACEMRKRSVEYEICLPLLEYFYLIDEAGPPRLEGCCLFGKRHGHAEC
jgi:hypothetical protein